MQATLDSPLTLDPQQASALIVRSAHVDFVARTVHIVFDYVAANGAQIRRHTIIANGPQVETWIGNQETAIYNRLLAKLGVTGTVA